MIKRLVKSASYALNMDIEHEHGRTHAQFMLVFGALAVVSFFMTFLNIVTSWITLSTITCVFGVCCTLDLLIELQAKTDKGREVGRSAFGFEAVAMCTAFLIVGEPEGFSVLWVLLIPASGFYLFRFKWGLVVSAAQWFILMFLLWTPLGSSFLQYDYTVTFRTRFPILFIAFTGVGLLLELVRKNASEKLKQAKEEYEYMYKHDALTGLYNRYGFTKMFGDFSVIRSNSAFSFGIFDLDHFKRVNDTYGHLNGDEVLKAVAANAKGYFGDEGIVCRWGGEEFAVLIKNDEKSKELAEGLIELARVTPLKLLDNEGEIIVRLSMGIVHVRQGQNFDDSRLFMLADDLLYKAKETGRNQVIYGDYSE